VRGRLILIVFSLDSGSQLFSHQRRVAIAVSKLFSRVNVITLDAKVDNLGTLPKNLTIYPVDWSSSDFIVFKIFKLLRVFFKVLSLSDRKDTVIFSHMTDLPCALISPFSKLFKVPHVLWYAHSRYSFYLKISALFVSRILTSTEGSCPYQGKKLSIIGQMVDETFFQSQDERSLKPFRTILHVGRLDPSKRIDEVISAFLLTFGLYPDAKLFLIGFPTPGNEDYVNQIKAEFAYAIANERIVFLGKLRSEEVVTWIKKSDVLLHAYRGSLDKVLVEAALLQLPILSTNSEFNRIFGMFSASSNPNLENSLLTQCQFFLTAPRGEIESLARKRREISLKNHSLTSWICKLANVFQSL